jgi:hypothetical protein
MCRFTRFTRNIAPLFFLSFAVVPFASASGPYVIGSGNTVTAAPTIPRPATTPCVVQLFSGAQFTDFNVENFTYTPPSACPGPWAKIVLESDINLNPGIQYDRTANYWLGPVNIYFGTTSEPSPTLGPSWHVEKDLTDYSAIFYASQSGQADIGNTLCCGLTSTIFASAELEFYPLAQGQKPPVVADQILALSNGPSGGTVTLSSGSDSLSGTFNFPLNVSAAYLDVYSQGQGGNTTGDEFWYTCVPNDVTGELESCGNTAFRETEITIDGQPAGVAPVYPWIFTGGIDPFLWFPIPGVQTLEFAPYRVNLTPFAGVLSNGQPHTVGLSVFNADSYFEATASLLVYVDAETPVITGAVTQNTLTANPTPVVTENLHTSSKALTGTMDVDSKRNFTISGYINTAHGKVTTSVSQSVTFNNHQSFDITLNGATYIQNISQQSGVNSYVRVSRKGEPETLTYVNFAFPLVVDIAETTLANGDIDQTTEAYQTYQRTQTTLQGGKTTFSGSLESNGQHADTLEFDSSFNFLGNKDQYTAAQYNQFNSDGYGYYCSIGAKNNKLTTFSPSCAP